MKYELHITILTDDPDKVERNVEPMWHFSKIDGDPDLGKGIKCYLTTHVESEEYINIVDIINNLESTASKIQKAGYNVIRCKLEEILYDRRGRRD